MDKLLKLKKEFNWNYYIERYPDLKEAGVNTAEKALRHYQHFGQKEGRVYSHELPEPVVPEPVVPEPIVAKLVVPEQGVQEQGVQETVVPEPEAEPEAETCEAEPEAETCDAEPGEAETCDGDLDQVVLTLPPVKTSVEPEQEEDETVNELIAEVVSEVFTPPGESIELVIGEETKPVKKPRNTRRKKNV
jgi:hypothetical protein